MTNRSLKSNSFAIIKWSWTGPGTWLVCELLSEAGAKTFVMDLLQKFLPTLVPFINELGVMLLYGLIFGAGAATQEWLQARKTRKKLEAEAAEKAKEKVKAKQAPKPWDVERIGHDCIIEYERLKYNGPHLGQSPFGHAENARIRRALKDLQSLGIPTPLDQESSNFSPEYAVKFLGIVAPYVLHGLVEEAKIEAAKALSV